MAVTQQADGGARVIDVETLRRSILAGEDLAVLDVRGAAAYARGHISVAAFLPLDELAWRARALLPFTGTRIVLVGDEDEIDSARAILARLGYERLLALAGGLPAWSAAGGELLAGMHATSKALGEIAERRHDIPSIEPADLAARLGAGEALTIVDTRTRREFHDFSIPCSVSAPGASVLERVLALSRDVASEGAIVVTCGGRTRGIIGAGILREAGGLTNVLVLQNGVSGWRLADLPLRCGDDGDGGDVAAGPRTDDLPAADRAAAAVAEWARANGVPVLQSEDVRAWHAAARRRTTYWFDVRDLERQSDVLFSGAHAVPGGELLQALDRHIAVWPARIVLLDDDSLSRAHPTAVWLRRLGLAHVAVCPASHLALAGLPATAPDELVSPADPDGGQPPEALAPIEVRARLDAGSAVLIDVEPAHARAPLRWHVPGSFIIRRTVLEERLDSLFPGQLLVLVSEDGRFAAHVAAGLARRRGVAVLAGGVQGWRGAGLALASEASQPAIGEVERPGALTGLAHYRRYVAWGDQVGEQLARDGLIHVRL